MVSKRIKYARAHLSRRKHLELLARPLWRRITKTDVNFNPNPYHIPRSAMRARANKRIKLMSKPKHVVKKFDRSQSRVSLQYPRAHRQEFREPSKWLFDLALPKRSLLKHSRYYGVALGNRHLLANIDSQLRGVQKSRYRQYRIVCNALQKLAAARDAKIRKKLRRALTQPGDWERHKKFLDRVAAPKQIPKPPEPPREPKGQYSALRLMELAKPAHKRDGLGVDPFKVQRSALVYELTAHTERLATRENPREDPPYNIPGQVVPEALHAAASPRTLELAKPAVRQPGRETDLREDAFSVNPMALKAWCSPRLKKLAKPKHKVRKR